MKKLASLFLVFLLIGVGCVPVFTGTSVLAATSSAQATTMRLKKTEGTVSMTNQNGRSLPLKEDSKLYSGYTLSTQKASYAYVDLDNSKAVKLDEFSTASVKKSGNKLDLSLQSGKLFFNVKVPLQKNESMNIRTATMVTGIRGTAGIVVVPDENTSIFYLLDGEVALTDLDPATGETKQVKVKAGESAVSTRMTAANGQEGTKVQVQEYKEEDVSGFVAVEIAKDPELKEKIEEETGWNVEQIVQKAEETLQKDQEINNQKQQEADIAAANQKQTATVEALFPDAASPSEETGKDQENSQKENDAVVSENQMKLTNATASQINQALATYKIVSLDGTSGALDQPITIPAGKTLRLKTGTITLQSSLEVYGNLEIASGAQLVNQGQIHTGSSSQQGKITIQSGSTFQNTASGTVVNQNGTLENKGTFQIKGTVTNLDQLNNQGNLDIEENGSLINTKQDSTAGRLKNIGGTMTIASSGKLENYSMLEMDRTIYNQGVIIVSEESLFRSVGGIAIADGGNLRMQDNKSVYANSIGKGNDIFIFFSMDHFLSFEQQYNKVQKAEYSLTKQILLDGDVNVPEGMDITLDLAGENFIFAIEREFNNYGTLTVKDSKGGGNLDVARTALTNYGTFTLQSGLLSSQNMDGVLWNMDGAQTYIKGGTVSAAGIQISNEGTSADLKISGGVIESTRGDNPAVEGPFTYTGGTIRAKNNLVCDPLPDGWKVSDGADTDGWFTLEKDSRP